MKLHGIAAALVMVVISMGLLRAQDAPPVNTLSAAEKEAGWKLLFDGKSTEGWRNYRKQTVGAGWKIIDGALTRAEKGAGDIITTEQYDSFELLIDYKIAPGGNSGVMYHVTEEGATPWQTGPEVQILDNAAGKDPQRAGWLYQLYQPAIDPKTGKPIDATRPAGEWNTLRIVITPEKCEHFMNGVKYVEYVKGSDDWNQRVARSKFGKMPLFGKAARGHICLQDHGNEVAFRNIKIRPIAGK